MMNRLRSLLFTPGHNMRMLAKAGALGADAVIVDLEDAVPMGDKETARWFTRDTLPTLAEQKSAVFVRVNALTTGLTATDVQWVVQAGLDGIVLPKSESAADVQQAAALLEQEEKTRKLAAGRIQIVPLLETARAVACAGAIAAAHARVQAVAFGGVDFSRDMGVELTRAGDELAHARARIALMAHAEGRFAIDTPWIDVHDADGLIQHAQTARQLGFHGKLLIHPGQVDPVNRTFSPSPEAVAAARKIVEAFQAADRNGAGAISLDGKMIDAANYQQARDLLAFRAELDAG